MAKKGLSRFNGTWVDEDGETRRTVFGVANLEGKKAEEFIFKHHGDKKDLKLTPAGEFPAEMTTEQILAAGPGAGTVAESAPATPATPRRRPLGNQPVTEGEAADGRGTGA